MVDWESGLHAHIPERIRIETLKEGCDLWKQRGEEEVIVCHLQAGEDLDKVKKLLGVAQNRLTEVLIVVGHPVNGPTTAEVANMVKAYRAAIKLDMKIGSSFINSYRQVQIDMIFWGVFRVLGPPSLVSISQALVAAAFLSIHAYPFLPPFHL